MKTAEQIKAMMPRTAENVIRDLMPFIEAEAVKGGKSLRPDAHSAMRDPAVWNVDPKHAKPGSLAGLVFAELKRNGFVIAWKSKCEGYEMYDNFLEIRWA